MVYKVLLVRDQYGHGFLLICDIWELVLVLSGRRDVDS